MTIVLFPVSSATPQPTAKSQYITQKL